MDETRLRLLNAAGPIFAERGYRATTVREISQEAGTNLAAISYHFEDKEGFYIAAVKHAAQGCMDRVPLPQWGAAVSAEEKLLGFVTTFLNRVAVDHDPAWHGQLLMREMVLPTRACAEFVRDYVRPMHGMLLGVLCELMPKSSEKERWLTALSIVGQCLHHRVGQAVMIELTGETAVAAFGVKKLAEHITSFSLAAIEHATKLRSSKSKLAAPGTNRRVDRPARKRGSR
ncbi:MAG: CerR family C-terminal domain-containing protein [Planctomycetia bacterium]|nr:CerR family C-terminal domain-containing protein [Planctomycetia bacterium]